jgi:hypothetical protein
VGTETSLELVPCDGVDVCMGVAVCFPQVCVTPGLSEKFKTCQANAFHLNSNRKISNNLIGCISWHTYFYF